MPGTDAFDRLLRLADGLQEPVFTFDEVHRWPTGLLEQFVQVGLLQEIEPAREVRCESCEEGHLLTPDIREYPAVGRTIGVARCPECGRVTVELDRLRQWSIHFEGLASLLAAGLDFHPPVEAVVADRLCLLGLLSTSSGPLDLFLARGLCWPDAASTVGAADRLRAASCPVVVVPDRLPAPDIWSSIRPTVLSLSELSTWDNTEGRPDFSPLVDMMRTIRPPVKEVNWLTVTEGAQLLLQDVSGLDLEKAKARVSKAATAGKFRTNGQSGAARRIDCDSFSTWRLEQRERDLDAEDA